MTIFRIVSFMIEAFLALGLATQIIIPLWRDTPLFPIMRWKGGFGRMAETLKQMQDVKVSTDAERLRTSFIEAEKQFNQQKLANNRASSRSRSRS